MPLSTTDKVVSVGIVIVLVFTPVTWPVPFVSTSSTRVNVPPNAGDTPVFVPSVLVVLL